MATKLNLDLEIGEEAAIQERLISLEEKQNRPSQKEVHSKGVSEDQTDRKQPMQMGLKRGEPDYRLDILRQSEGSGGLCDLSTNDNNNLNINEEEIATNNHNVVEASPTPMVLLADPGRLQVIKSTRFMDDLGKEIKLYRTRGLQRGALVVFSYSEFTTGENYRDVASDNEMLQDLFRQIGFKLILPYENKTKQETLDIMKSLKLEGFECLFFVVSSHGYGRDGMWDTDIRCTDGGFISSHQVVDIFNSKNYPALDGVPKVFIFQACRGKKFLKELRGVMTDVSHFNDDQASGGASTGRSYSDILIAHSTLPGFVSPRNEGNNKGSWYKQALCSVFAAHAHDHHALELFQLADGALQRRCPGATTTVESWGFNKHLYLHPGLAEDANGNPKPIQ